MLLLWFVVVNGSLCCPYYLQTQSWLSIQSNRSFSWPRPPLRRVAKSTKFVHAHWVVGKWEPFRKGDVVTKWFSFTNHPMRIVRILWILLRNTMAAAAVNKIYKVPSRCIIGIRSNWCMNMDGMERNISVLKMQETSPSVRQNVEFHNID
jgi:hypothetical protein